MTEQVESDDAPDLSALDTASNILLLSPSLGQHGKTACITLLGRAPPDQTNVLSITYSESARKFVDRWVDHAGGPPVRGGIITVGDAGGGIDDPTWAVRGLENAGDLTGLGIKLSELLSGMDDAAGEDEAITVCFNNITTLLQYADLQRTFRFLHVVTGRVETIGAVAHYHLDPDAHDKQTLATLKGLFDAVVEVGEDGSWSVQR